MCHKYGTFISGEAFCAPQGAAAAPRLFLPSYQICSAGAPLILPLPDLLIGHIAGNPVRAIMTHHSSSLLLRSSFSLCVINMAAAVYGIQNGPHPPDASPRLGSYLLSVFSVTVHPFPPLHGATIYARKSMVHLCHISCICHKSVPLFLLSSFVPSVLVS